MKFSILVPVYNMETWLPACLDSISKQAGDFEVILVDDGSTDASGSICDEFAQNHPYCSVWHQENAGSLIARETAVKHASGDYFVFCDADDRLHPNLLSCLSKQLSTDHADLIFYDAVVFMNETTLRFLKPNLPIGSSADKQLLFNQLFLTYSVNPMWIKCCRRELFSPYIFNSENICYGDDLLESACLFKEAKSFTYLPETLYYYRSNSGMMRKFDPEYYQKLKRVNSEAVSLLKDEMIPDLFQKSSVHLLRSAYSAVIQYRYIQNTYSEALQCIAEDQSFIDAYRSVMKTECRKYLSEKERLVLTLLFHKQFTPLKILIELQRKLDMIKVQKNSSQGTAAPIDH